MRTHPRKLVLLVPLVAIGCGGAGAATPASEVPVPERITEAEYAEALRTLHQLSVDDPQRDHVRKRIVAYLDRRGSSVVETGPYEAVVEHFEAIAGLYSPEELGRGALPPELEAPARYLHEHGSQRGDEGRALAALWTLQALYPDRARFQREYREVASWGKAAREGLDNPLEQYTGLIEVWDAHARLTPAPEVLDTLAKLHLERRDVIVRALRSGDGVSVSDMFGGVFGMAPHHVLRRAPFEVAAVYLRHGDVSSAMTRIETMGHASDVEAQLLRVLRDSRTPGDEGADALVELAEAYRSARPDVAFGLCRDGLRRNPKDPRFPTCLARVAAEQERYEDATAWYAEAIEVAPSQRGLYDEALEKLNEFIEEGLFDAEPAGARGLVSHAERILSERVRRWPRSEPPVPPARLDLLVGTLEMNAGNVDEARTRLERSLEAGESTEALLSLATLEQRLGQGERAATLYERALETTPERTPAEVLRRAEVRERLGDVLRADDKEGQAEAMYRRGLEALDQVVPHLEGPPLALVLVRRGVLLSRLDRKEASEEAFRGAMRTAPHWRETYAGVLSHLAVAKPDLPFAHEVFRQARRQLTLEPEWKVYFALWVDLIAARAGQRSEGDVRQVLQGLSSGAAWWARLAKLGIGRLPYEEALAEASNVGERAEAHFYEGVRRLGVGDPAGAQRLFQRTLETRMVSFYEYIMAQELLAGE